MSESGLGPTRTPNTPISSGSIRRTHKMAFTRGQTQVLYQFLPGAVFEHDQYGFCRISSVELQEKPVNQDAVFNAVSDLLFQWPDDTFRAGFADPRQPHNRRLYAIGTPALVRFEPFPS